MKSVEQTITPTQATGERKKKKLRSWELMNFLEPMRELRRSLMRLRIERIERANTTILKYRERQTLFKPKEKTQPDIFIELLKAEWECEVLGGWRHVCIGSPTLSKDFPLGIHRKSWERAHENFPCDTGWSRGKNRSHCQHTARLTISIISEEQEP